MTRNKNIKGKYHVRIMLRDVFSFAKHQRNATYAPGFKLKLTIDNDEAVLDKAAGIADARNKIDHIHWYVPHYTPSIP